MSALGSLVVKLALNHAEYTQGLSKTSQSSLKFAQNSQRAFDRAERAAKRAFRNVALGAAGMVASFVGVNASLSKVKGIIDAQDQIGKLSQKTGLAVESLAGLDFAASQSGTNLDRTAKGVRGFSRIIADSSGAPNKFTEILGAMGVQIDELKSKSPEEQFLALADAVQDLGEQDRAVAVTSLLGDRMADLVPLLSGGSDRLRDLIAEGQKYNPVTAESASRAEVFNDNLDRLGRSSGVLAQELTIGLVSSLSEVAAQMARASEQGGIMQGVIAGIGATADAVFTSSGFLKLVEFSGPLGSVLAGRVRDQKFDEFIKNRQGILPADPVSALLNAPEEAQSKRLAERLAEIDKQFNNAAISSNTLTKSELDQERETESLASDIQALTRAYDPLIERNERLARLLQKRDAGLSDDIFEAEATAAINKYTQATANLGDTVDDVASKHVNLREVSRKVFLDNEQFGIQAARGVQRAFASFLSGTETDFERTFKNISAQASSFVILGGIESIFTGGSGKSSQDNGLFSIFDSLLDVNKSSKKSTDQIAAASDVTAAWLGKIGKESRFSVSGATDRLSGAAQSAFANANPIAGALTVTAGSLAGAGGNATALAGTAATFGGPVGIIAAAGIIATDILDKKFGDFKLGEAGKAARTATDITSLGGTFVSRKINPFGLPDPVTLVLKALFGRGPLEQKRTTLTGRLGSEGFDQATLASFFKASGGAFKSSKRDFATVDLLGNTNTDNENLGGFVNDLAKFARQIFGAIDDSVKATSKSLLDMGSNLNLSTEGVTSFNREINLISEKGELLTDEQISNEIRNITDELSRGLLPAVDDLSKTGETAFQSISRLNDEFNVLTDVMLLLGRNTEEARGELLGLSFDQRADLVNKLGGTGEANAAFNSFFDNFLSPEEQLKIFTDKLLIELKEFDINRVVSPQEVVDAFFSGTLSTDDIAGVLDQNMQSLILNVDRLKNIAQGASESIDSNLNNSFTTLEKSVNTERNRLANEYNESVQETTQSISTLTTLSNALNTATETINLLGLTGARDSIRNAIADATSGNVVELSSVRSALVKLTDNDTSAFSTRLDFQRSQAVNTSLLSELGSLTDNQLTAEEQSLDALKSGFDAGIGRLDSIITEARTQIDLLVGIDAKLADLSVNDALGIFNRESVQAGGQGVSGLDGIIPFNGNSAFSSSEINSAYQSVKDNPFEAHRLAKANNVSAEQLAASVPGLSLSDINNFTDENGLERLATGTNFVPQDMPAFLHRGEEVKPKAFVDRDRAQNDEVEGLLKKILAALEKEDTPAKDTHNLLRRVITESDDGTLAINTKAAA